SGSWGYGISGMTHLFKGGLQIDANGVWSDNTGTISFEGVRSGTIAMNGTGSFKHLRIDKAENYTTMWLASNWDTGTEQAFQISKGILMINGVNFQTRGDLSVGNGGKLQLVPGSTLTLRSGKTLEIQSGGSLLSHGASGQRALITNLNGYHELNVLSGGTISAEQTIFEKMAADGINILSGAIVDPDYSFNNCWFRYGVMSGTLLKINNNQYLTITNPVFTSNPQPNGSQYNLTKTLNQGALSVEGESGAFSGMMYENDIYMRIHWSSDVPIIGFNQQSLEFNDVYITEYGEIDMGIGNPGTSYLVGTISTPDCFTVSTIGRIDHPEISVPPQKEAEFGGSRNVIDFSVPPGMVSYYRVRFT
ncbi:MAG: hypothetical protein U1B83_04100, partial [Candidatus Cloacimonadaceae bacterium]|nr:hypothetical protein [Candidatus Cloacimonadaceae bacterium]